MHTCLATGRIDIRCCQQTKQTTTYFKTALPRHTLVGNRPSPFFCATSKQKTHANLSLHRSRWFVYI